MIFLKNPGILHTTQPVAGLLQSVCVEGSAQSLVHCKGCVRHNGHTDGHQAWLDLYQSRWKLMCVSAIWCGGGAGRAQQRPQTLFTLTSGNSKNLSEQHHFLPAPVWSECP